jgi:hypothetical protein
MSPQGWLRFILEIVNSYEKGEQRPLQLLATRLSSLDNPGDSDTDDDPITDKIWGRSRQGLKVDVD